MGRTRTEARRRAAAETGITLDAGALIAVERGDESVRMILRRLTAANVPLAIPAGVLAQVWRGSARQQRLAVLMSDDDVDIPGLDMAQALAIGALLASARGRDVIDASVVVTARTRGDAVVTSDPEDLQRLDPMLRVIAV